MSLVVCRNFCSMYWVQLQTTGSGPKKERWQREKAPKKCVSFFLTVNRRDLFVFLLSFKKFPDFVKVLFFFFFRGCNPLESIRIYLFLKCYFSMSFRPKVSSALFFNYNTSLGPPYRVLIDTNFINFSIQNKVSDC